MDSRKGSICSSDAAWPLLPVCCPMVLFVHAQDLKEAKVQYSQLVRRLMSNGTTTAMVFGSLHLKPTMLLADILHQVRELRCPMVRCAVSTLGKGIASRHLGGYLRNMLMSPRCVRAADVPVSARMPSDYLLSPGQRGHGQGSGLCAECTRALLDATLPCALKPMLLHLLFRASVRL